MGKELPFSILNILGTNPDVKVSEAYGQTHEINGHSQEVELREVAFDGKTAGGKKVFRKAVGIKRPDLNKAVRILNQLRSSFVLRTDFTEDEDAPLLAIFADDDQQVDKLAAEFESKWAARRSFNQGTPISEIIARDYASSSTELPTLSEIAKGALSYAKSLRLPSWPNFKSFKPSKAYILPAVLGLGLAFLNFTPLADSAASSSNSQNSSESAATAQSTYQFEKEDKLAAELLGEEFKETSFFKGFVEGLVYQALAGEQLNPEDGKQVSWLLDQLKTQKGQEIYKQVAEEVYLKNSPENFIEATLTKEDGSVEKFLMMRHKDKEGNYIIYNVSVSDLAKTSAPLLGAAHIMDNILNLSVAHAESVEEEESESAPEEVPVEEPAPIKEEPVRIMPDNSIHYSQNKQWANDGIWNSGSGCGPTTMAMVLSRFGEKITPDEVSKIFVKEGIKAPGYTDTYMRGLGMAWLEKTKGYEVIKLSDGGSIDLERAKSLIDQGYLIIASSEITPWLNYNIDHIFGIEDISPNLHQMILFDPARQNHLKTKTLPSFKYVFAVRPGKQV
jgi:hypothetical protein